MPILDQFGRPMKPAMLTREIAAPTLTGVRQVLSGHPASGITPQRLAVILREAESGDPTRYLELAEDIEDRDLHYQGVLGTRKRAVSQLEVTVEAASDQAIDQKAADLVREWLDRDELEEDLFDILDAIGKGFSITEMIWDTRSQGRWFPGRLEWRDPRWFEFDLADGRTPLLRSDANDPLPTPAASPTSSTRAGLAPLPPHKFLVHFHKAKSGLPIRGGIARAASWAWMFKTFSLKDWVIFCEVYGQPIRLGKYDQGASEDDKDTLFKAVSNIASDCAAIIPDSMMIEFIKAEGAGGGTGSTGGQLFKELCDWLDQQVSKAVLGQTTTTDAISGGHAVAREHRQVQEDIERADAKSLAGVLNRHLVPPMVAFNLGPLKLYPRIRIGREEVRDLAATSEALSKLVPLGLKVQMSEVRDMLGFADPEPDAELLERQAAPEVDPRVKPGNDPGAGPDDEEEREEEETEQETASRGVACPRCGGRHAQEPPPDDVPDELASELETAAAAAGDALVDEVRGLLEQATSFEELAGLLAQRRQGMAPAELSTLLRNALVIAEMAGRSEIVG